MQESATPIEEETEMIDFDEIREDAYNISLRRD